MTQLQQPALEAVRTQEESERRSKQEQGAEELIAERKRVEVEFNHRWASSPFRRVVWVIPAILIILAFLITWLIRWSMTTILPGKNNCQYTNPSNWEAFRSFGIRNCAKYSQISVCLDRRGRARWTIRAVLGRPEAFTRKRTRDMSRHLERIQDRQWAALVIWAGFGVARLAKTVGSSRQHLIDWRWSFVDSSGNGKRPGAENEEM